MRIILPLVLAAMLIPQSAAVAKEFCEPAGTDCRAVVLRYINNEMVRIDVGTEEITDDLIADALIAKHRANVPVRMLVEPRRNLSEKRQIPILDKLKAAGIPMRYKPNGHILHWKMMNLAGQQVVQFGATQLSAHYLIPVQPFVNFTQDPIVFETDLAIVQSFQRKFDDAWVDAVNFVNYANSTTTARAYPLYPISTRMNFVPMENFLTRSKVVYDLENTAIDVMIYKVTSAGHADGMIRAAKRLPPGRVRLITEPARYRNTANIWQSYHVDRMHMAGVVIRDRAHIGFLHQ